MLEAKQSSVIEKQSSYSEPSFGEIRDSQALESAFVKFNEASMRLEAKHGELLAEVERLQEQLREKELEIKRAERLSTLGETAAALAHEVRNPLGAIKIFVSLLRREVKDSPSASSLTEQIDASIGALDNVVSNILHFSKEKKQEAVPLNLHSLLQEQLLLFKPFHRAGAEVKISLDAGPFMSGSESGLRQVLYNLLLNAFQATKYAGLVTVEMRDLDAGHLSIVVRDSGAGVAADMMERIFEPFVTSKNEGTGLGLAIVKKVIQEHGGDISVKNNPGAEFTVRLPRVRA